MKKKKGHLGLSNSFHYTLMVLPGYIWLFMFSIVPMVGIVMAKMGTALSAMTILVIILLLLIMQNIEVFIMALKLM